MDTCLFKGDKEVGKFTYIDKKGKSTNDFALISKGLLDQSVEFYVHEPNAYSDHCPIELKLVNFSIYKNNPYSHVCENMNVDENIDNVNPFISYRFNPDDKDVFFNKMNDDYATSKLNSILEMIQSENMPIDNVNIESCISSLNHVLEYAASSFACKPKTNSSHTDTEYRKNFWYDIECENNNKKKRIRQC